MSQGCRSSPPAYVYSLTAGLRQPYAIVNFIPPVRDYDKMLSFKGECAQFIVNKCPIYTDYSASAKFNTNSHETDYSAAHEPSLWSVAEFMGPLRES